MEELIHLKITVLKWCRCIFTDFFLQGEDDSWFASSRDRKSGLGVKGKRGVAGKTEVEVIRDWFINIFQPVEKTADIEVTDFKFEQLNHLRAQYQQDKRGQRG